MDCPLCAIWEREPENFIHYEHDYFVMNCKDLKGHKRRIMIVHKYHVDKQPVFIVNDMIKVLSDVCLNVFDYTEKAIIMDGQFGSIPEHYHLVATDLEQGCDDFKQILGTRWLNVIHIKDWVK